MSASSSQLDRIEAKLDRLESQLAQLPGAVATAGEVLDDLAERTPGGAAGLDARLRAAGELVLALSDPGVLQALEAAVGLAKGLPDLLATLGDGFDDLVERSRAHGMDLDRSVRGLVAHGALRADNLELITRALAAMGPAARVPPEPVGLWGLLSAMREPEVQRSLSFLLTYARRFGALVDHLDPPGPAYAVDEEALPEAPTPPKGET